jgi:hypothetical protein
MRAREFGPNAHVREPVHLQNGRFNHPPLKVWASRELPRRDPQQVAEALKGKVFNAAIKAGTKLDKLVERHRILTGHSTDDLSLDPAPPVRPHQNGAKLLWDTKSDCRIGSGLVG